MTLGAGRPLSITSEFLSTLKPRFVFEFGFSYRDSSLNRS